MAVDISLLTLIFESIEMTDKPAVVISPTTFNVDKNVVGLFDFVIPDTLKAVPTFI